jgi:hypothetical protein
MGSNKGGLRTFNWDLKTGYKPTQWRSTVSAPLCALCNKAVFPAEEVTGAGQKYHKLCLKCSKYSQLICFLFHSFTCYRSSFMQYFTQFR